MQLKSDCCPVAVLLLTAAAVTAVRGQMQCDVAKLRSCLLPVSTHLNTYSKGSDNNTLFRASLQHYYQTLDDQHSAFIHIHSLNTVMNRMDEVFVLPRQMPATCSVLTRAEKCLKNYEVFCNEETRDELAGIENMFNYMCQPNNRQVYKRNYLCLTKNKDLEDTRETIAQQLNNWLNTIIQPEDENGTLVTGDVLQSEDSVKYDLYRGGVRLWRPDPNHPDHDYISAEYDTFNNKICREVEQALLGYQDAVTGQCNATAGRWQYELRRALVQILLIDLNCVQDYVGYHSLLNETGCFACYSGDECIDWKWHCDGEQHCQDGSDERRCSSLNSSKILSIVVGLVVTGTLLIVICICVLKCKDETDFVHRIKTSDSSSTEMMSITQQELSIGDSTPPITTKGGGASSGGGTFIYKAVPTNNNLTGEDITYHDTNAGRA